MSSGGRLAYIDWLRGVAVVLMILVHAFNGWLTPDQKENAVYLWVRTVGGYPAPLFLFLAGLGLALLMENRRQQGKGSGAARREGALRGVEVIGWAFLFRLWMLTTALFGSVGDVARVDVLNCIGVSMVLVAILGLGWERFGARLAACALLAVGIAMLTPLAWDARPGWVPDALLGYVNGRLPNALFPLFPWGAFTAAGAAAGLLLAWARQSQREVATIAGLALAGAAAYPLAQLLERSGPALYAHPDFWRTSPLFFLQRLGAVLALLGVARLLGQGARWSPLRQLGRTSLLVYWVHIEIVYGKLLLPRLRHAMDMRATGCAFALLVLAMIAISYARTDALERRRAPALPQA